MASIQFGTPGQATGRKVLMMRHGRGPHQDGSKEIDPLLSETGRAQAASWAPLIRKLGAELVIVSPLKRASETACLAFQHDDVVFHTCQYAREDVWRWPGPENQFGPVECLQQLFENYGRGPADARATQAMDEASAPMASSFENSITELRRVIASSSANIVVVVCHWGVINALCKESANNCEVICCDLLSDGRLKSVEKFKCPLDMSDMYLARVRVIAESSEGGKYYKEGDMGICTSDTSDKGGDRVRVRFDNGKICDPPRKRLEVISEAQ